MREHPIEGLMTTAMNSIQDMIDVNTIIGDPIETSNNIVIIPISKVTFGFAAGGSEFKGETVDEYQKKDKEEAIQYRLPFGGGSGAGVSINPVAFLVIEGQKVKLMPISHLSSMDKLLDYIPEVIEKTNCMINKCLQNKQEKKSKTVDKIEKQEEKQIKQEEKKAEEKNDKSQENNEEIITRIKKERRRRERKPIISDIDYDIEYEEKNDFIDD